MKKDKKIYYSMIVISFLTLYLVSMVFSTYMVKENYVKEYRDYLTNLKHGMVEAFEQDRASVFEVENSKKKNRELSYFNYMILINTGGMDKYQTISMAIYDGDGNLVTQTQNMFGNSRNMYRYEDYFTETEMEELVGLYPESETENNEITDNGNFFVMLYYLDGYQEPMGVELIKFGSGDLLWNWTNVMTGPDGYENYDDKATGYLFFPYLKNGQDAWEKWQEDKWLQNYPEKERSSIYEMKMFEKENFGYAVGSFGNDEFAQNREVTSEVFNWGDYEESLVTEGSKEEITDKVQIYSIELRQRIHPWLAAMNYMRYVYLGGAILVLCCLGLVLYAVKKTIKRQEELEKQRRDFMNAAAHELKTPLGIVRGFAENVKENTVEEKKDYYLNQIISQTELMDDLVKEMIGISKMNSSDLIAEKENISVKILLEEQIEKAQPIIEEKHIDLQMDLLDDFTIVGNRNYIGKAFWNLIDNAIVHNNEDGWIRITLTSEFCSIENTGKTISEENMEHVKDMFFTGDESRHDSKNHRGLGLYLANQIFEMHDLMLEIGNREDGVMVTVRRKV